ncbi:MAG: hypothetical protein A2V88_07705 [Elusimicrobia bacterium RBG_16_66_12]|nr:MAG: hypothetical protein A2V88_07705 [Elusimicrobia bacterium RBG_16_66_12]
MERFGVVSLFWAVLGYLSLFDLGFGRATTRFVAQALGAGDIKRVSPLVWTSLLVQALLGCVGGVLLASVTPFLVKALNISVGLQEESTQAFQMLGVGVPLAICATSLRGTLEAAQRFGLANAVRIPSLSMQFAAPMIAGLLGYGLTGVTFLLVVIQALTALSYLALCSLAIPSLRKRPSVQFRILRPLLSFGGWVTLYSMIVPVTIYLDRFLIASLLSMATVAYYTVPHELLSRLQIIPASLSASMFPAISALGLSRGEDVQRLYRESMRFLLMLMALLTTALVLFGEEMLELWLGASFGAYSAPVLRLLAIGFLLSALVWPSSALHHGIGRPDVVAKLFAVNLPLYAGVAWLLISRLGLQGAAGAMVVRGGLELLLFYRASLNALSTRRVDVGVLAPAVLWASVLSLAFVLATRMPPWTVLKFSTGLTLMILASVASWQFLLDERERRWIRSLEWVREYR